MQSPASTVDAYVAALPPDRREAIEAVRKAVNAALPAGYEEGMSYGMIWWCVPHARYPAGYHCNPAQPLPFMGLASQKSGMSLHLMCIYGHESRRRAFEAAWKASGKKLDMGKACVRFKRLDDLALDAVTTTVARIPVATYVAGYEAALAGRRPAPKSAKSTKSPRAAKPARAAAATPSKPARKPAAKPRRATS